MVSFPSFVLKFGNLNVGIPACTEPAKTNQFISIGMCSLLMRLPEYYIPERVNGDFPFLFSK